jgi:uncharacterized protein YecA (UPF0149 family)
MKREEQIRLEIERLEVELKGLEEGRSKHIRLLSDYNHQEKVDAFDSFYRIAEEHLSDVEKTRGKNDDIENWCFEAVMGLLKNKVDESNPHSNLLFWNYYNSLL